MNTKSIMTDKTEDKLPQVKERQPEDKNLQELLQADKMAEDNAMTNALQANMKAVEKSNKGHI